ncbi:MAG TPA: ABC transporter permease [Mycobacteriales bacterium]
MKARRSTIAVAAAAAAAAVLAGCSTGTTTGTDSGSGDSPAPSVATTLGADTNGVPAAITAAGGSQLLPGPKPQGVSAQYGIEVVVKQTGTFARGSVAAVAGAPGAAALAGPVQGLVVSWLRLPPFIVTLAGLAGIRGLILFITHEGNDHPVIDGTRGFEVLGTGRLAGIGTPVWIMLVVFAIGRWALNRTAFGQSVQAVGGNQDAAELMGLPVRRTTTIVYVVSAPCAGLAGVLTTALSGGGREARIGDSYELPAIAAVVIGGTLLAGGVGSVIGSLAGVLLLFVIQNLIVQGANLNSYVQQVVSGGFLLAVVIIQAGLSARSRTTEA